MPRIVLIHGAATTARIWDATLPFLSSHDVHAPERPRTGDLERELASLAPLVDGAWVVGMSGGATLGLALAARGVPIAGAVLHEPAVGSLAPELLTPAARAFATGGTDAFGSYLYGPTWEPAMAGDISVSTMAAELAMFRGVEPGPVKAPSGPVLVTYGARSPDVRRHAAEALRDAHGHQIRMLPGVGHFAAVEDPGTLARVITEVSDDRGA